YPGMVVAWSAAGFLTGFARSYHELLACRFLLGLCEAAHWPCALTTTRYLLAPGQRAMGNGILQSGAAIGAVLTPWVIMPFIDPAFSWSADEHAWRYPFFLVGGLGVFWAALWLAVVPRGVLGRPAPSPAGSPAWRDMRQVYAD